jgi:hypothetical protein
VCKFIFGPIIASDSTTTVRVISRQTERPRYDPGLLCRLLEVNQLVVAKVGILLTEGYSRLMQSVT